MPHHDTDSNAAEDRRHRGAGALVVVGLLGTAVGAAAALLLSPWRGSEARQRLKERAKDVGSKVGAKAKDVGAQVGAKAKDIGSQVGAKAKDVGSQVGAKAKEMAAKARDACPSKAAEDEEEV